MRTHFENEVTLQMQDGDEMVQKEWREDMKRGQLVLLHAVMAKCHAAEIQ